MWCELLGVFFFHFKNLFSVNDEFITIRDCFWEYVDDECFYNKVPDDIQLESCATCDSDGCNGYNGVPKYTSKAVLPKPYKILSVLSFLLCVLHTVERIKFLAYKKMVF